MSGSDEDDTYGPPLPPGFKTKSYDAGSALPLHESKSAQENSKIHHRLAKYGDFSDEEPCSPALPPHMLKNINKVNVKYNQSDYSDEDAYLPQLPPGLQRKAENSQKSSDDDDDAYVPELPPGLQKNAENKKRRSEFESKESKCFKKDDKDSEDDDDDIYGAALPPHLMKNRNNSSSSPMAPRIKGPSLPAGYVPPESTACFENNCNEKQESSEEEEEHYGPTVGPMPSTVAFNEEEYRAQQFELRAKRMKDKIEGKFDDSKPVKRETWMLELPEDKANYCGLAPRQFLKKTPREKGDRSIWTDTPSDKARKAQMEECDVKTDPEQDLLETLSKQRDDDLTARVDKYNEEKRAKPLIDLHKKKMKEKKKESGPQERKPFSREEDMNVNKFDEAQKNNILKKARQLNDRFSAGGRKFL